MAKISQKKGEENALAVGRRKSAAARVKIKLGKGKTEVNGLPIEEYFVPLELQQICLAPLVSVAKEKNFDVSVKVVGGGKAGQAIAIQLGIARALIKWNEEWKKTLKTLGYLTRDPRVKERKKFGLKKARRAPQWSKR